MPQRPTPTDPTPDGALDEGPLRLIVGYQLAQAAVGTEAVFTEAVGRTLDLRPVEFTVLVLVAQNPGVSPGQLARSLAVSPAYISPCLERLAERGLLVRSRGTRDRRAQHVSATDAGRELAGRAVTLVIDAEHSAFSALTASEHALLTRLLTKAARRPRSGPPD